MSIKTNRQRLMASTFIFGVALTLLTGTQASAQSTTVDSAQEHPTTTQTEGQPAPTTRDVPEAGGQNAPAQPTSVQEVVVTGSRIARQDYVADSPIVSVGPKAFEDTGPATVETLLSELPQFVPGATSTSNNPPDGGQAQIELRGLGTQRTLVLLDGRRAQPANADNSVDVDTIPQALIDNVEIISGGASAAYGSDAVAGVVNFKLKHNFQGVVIDAQGGETERNDGAEELISATAGGNFDDNKGNAVISMQYTNRSAVLNGARAFSAVSGASGTSPYGAIDNIGTNLPSQAAIDGIFARYGVAAGTVQNSATRYGFNGNGTLFYNGVNYLGNTTGLDYSTIPVNGTYNTGALNYLQIPLTKYNFFGRSEYDINPHFKPYLQFNYTYSNVSEELAPSPAAGTPGPGNTGFLVPVTNPFISPDLATLLASRADPAADFLIRERFTDVGPRQEEDVYNVFQFVTGMSGELAGDWTYDAYLTYGRSNDLTQEFGNINRGNVNTLLDAADGGASLCAGGYNPFGLQALSSQCAGYISETTHNSTFEEQRVAEVDVQGSVIQLPAGSLKVALGSDYRSNSYGFSPDALLASTLPDGSPGVAGFDYTPPESGTTDVYELYGEGFIPVVRDLPFLKEVNLDLGYRFSDYGAGDANVGGVSTYKMDLDWEVVTGFRIRGGYQRAIRAPNVGELYEPPSQDFPNVGYASKTSAGTGDPCDVTGGYRNLNATTAAAVRALCLAQGVPGQTIDTYTYDENQVVGTVQGSTNLKQENADTYSVGAVWSPRFQSPLLRRLSASLDYYHIIIHNAVAELPGQVIVQKCFNADGSNPTYTETNAYCQLITRDPGTGNISNVNEELANIGAYKTSGADFQIDWSFGLGAVGLDDRFGTLGFNLVGGWLQEFSISELPGTPFTNYAGSIGNESIDDIAIAHPRWKLATTVDYGVGPVDLNLRWRYITGMEDSSCVGVPDCTAQGTPDVSYFDLIGRWNVNDSIQLRFGVNNLGDKQPPIFSSYSQANTDPSTYDVLGRRYFAGLKARF